MPFLADDMLNQLVGMCKMQRIFVHGDIYKAKYLVKTNFNFYTDKHKWNSFGGIQFFVDNNGKRMEGYYNFTDPDIAKICRNSLRIRQNLLQGILTALQERDTRCTEGREGASEPCS